MSPIARRGQALMDRLSRLPQSELGGEVPSPSRRLRVTHEVVPENRLRVETASDSGGKANV